MFYHSEVVLKYLYIYLIFINTIALFVTVHDKRAAVRGRWRVKERTLMMIATLGGAVTMYLTMLTIRHKTKKPLFMIGIPLVFLLELAVLFLVLHYGYRIV